mmetsp:Transcript_7724/g.25733  ORF Transcript_7724/g.25733 Transcript_7724/m.25733 type:complete len:362 (-) Transcript_7724:2577-3662(-)
MYSTFRRFTGRATPRNSSSAAALVNRACSSQSLRLSRENVSLPVCAAAAASPSSSSSGAGAIPRVFVPPRAPRVSSLPPFALAGACSSQNARNHSCTFAASPASCSKTYAAHASGREGDAPPCSGQHEHRSSANGVAICCSSASLGAACTADLNRVVDVTQKISMPGNDEGGDEACFFVMDTRKADAPRRASSARDTFFSFAAAEVPRPRVAPLSWSGASASISRDVSLSRAVSVSSSRLCLPRSAAATSKARARSGPALLRATSAAATAAPSGEAKSDASEDSFSSLWRARLSVTVSERGSSCLDFSTPGGSTEAGSTAVFSPRCGVPRSVPTSFGVPRASWSVCVVPPCAARRVCVDGG